LTTEKSFVFVFKSSKFPQEANTTRADMINIIFFIVVCLKI